jgi:hypothetical protein
MRQTTRQHLGGCLESVYKEAVSVLSLEKTYPRERKSEERMAPDFGAILRKIGA